MIGFLARWFHVFVVPSKTLMIILMVDYVLTTLFFLKTLSFTFICPTLFLSSCCHRKYRDEKLPIEDGIVDFERVWLLSPITYNHLMIFPERL